MNLVTTTYEKLELFDNPTEVLTMLTSDNVQNAPTDLKGDVQNIFQMLGENSPTQQLEWAKDLLKSIAYYDESPLVFRVYRGEDFSIRIDLEEGRDFTGFNLTIRRADDSTILSPESTQGESYSTSPVQYAYIEDLQLQPDQFVKVHVLLEHTDGNDLANGDVATLLTSAYLIVEGSLD